IGVLGGTFDPVHIGHLRGGLEVAEMMGLDELRLTPNARPPHRDTPQVSAIKQKFDKPFIEYLTQLRIQKAKTLLSSPGVSVKNVCYSVGYSDPNYFARVFKRETGMSPSKFQKKALRIED
ncbi:MAG: helix-turn-helix domain-containing protein, partial [Oscillospiraceae bacterium]|nr:helix-turn-helix domain-containing protein [Oscillospiraceae bacterium]